jgi:hypothetical protein
LVFVSGIENAWSGSKPLFQQEQGDDKSNRSRPCDRDRENVMSVTG